MLFFIFSSDLKLLSPEKVKLLLLSITINAPVFDALMLEQAEITDFISVVCFCLRYWFYNEFV